MPRTPRKRNVVKRQLKDGTIRTYVYEGSRPSHHPAPQTVGWLIAEYERSPEFAKLSPATKKLYQHALKLLDPIRHQSQADIRSKHIRAIRNSHQDRPGLANAFVSAAGALFSWALKNELREDFNPVSKVERLKLKERGPWPEEAIQAAEAAFTGGILTAFLLGLHTGQRRGDIISLRWSAYDGQFINLTQQKTQEPLTIPVAPPLKAHLDQLTRSGLYIVSREGGAPFTEGGFESAWRRAVAAIGHPKLLFHSLRHTTATRLAESGCSVFQIAAITGHRDLHTVRRYTKRAEQKKLAVAAMAQVYDFAGVAKDRKKTS